MTQLKTVQAEEQAAPYRCQKSGRLTSRVEVDDLYLVRRQVLHFTFVSSFMSEELVRSWGTWSEFVVNFMDLNKDNTPRDH